MNFYGQWAEDRVKIPPGLYEAICLKGEQKAIWHEGQNAWGRAEKVILWFKIFGGEHSGAIIPMFLTVGEGGKIHQGSKYFISWVIANGLIKPTRSRLKEMPPSKFEGKIFSCAVVDVKPRWKNGSALPEIFVYSRVDTIYELIAGNPKT